MLSGPKTARTVRRFIRTRHGACTDLPGGAQVDFTNSRNLIIAAVILVALGVAVLRTL